MTRDELRTAIQETVDSMRGDSMMALAATSTIMALVDQYSVWVVNATRASYLPKLTEQEVLPWLKERKK